MGHLDHERAARWRAQHEAEQCIGAYLPRWQKARRPETSSAHQLSGMLIAALVGLNDLRFVRAVRSNAPAATADREQPGDGANEHHIEPRGDQ